MEPNHSQLPPEMPGQAERSKGVMEQREHHGGGGHMPLWIALGVSLSLLLAVVAFIVGTQLAMDRSNDSDRGDDTEQVSDRNDEDSDSEDMDGEDGETDKGETVVVENASSLSINWIPVADQRDYIIADWVASMYDATTASGSSYLDEYYDTIKLGEVSGGQYDGFSLFQQDAFSEGPGPQSYFYYLKDPNGVSKPIILDRYGLRGNLDTISVREMMGDYYLERLGDYAVFSTVVVPELEPLNTFRSSTGKLYEYVRNSARASKDEIGNTSKQIGSTEDGYRIYEGNEGVIYLIREDGIKVEYAIDIPFWRDESVFVATPLIGWTDGLGSSEYSKAGIGGCGFESAVKVVENPSALGTLKVAGNGGGESIYVPEDLSLSYFDEKYRTWNQAFGGSRQEFAAIRPVFYWEDDLGRTLEFQHVDVLPAAECGKPVIYLYPEETMDVRVEVAPKGGFTFTEPAYNGGWEVTASPDGTLINKADGLEYPYLFWEGRGGLYQAPNQYWVVKRSGVKKFLKETLAQYGLNKQEIADFNEYWVPRMKDAKYYRIGFHTNAVMDEIAPLSVSGDPQTIFRILMDFDELDAWEEENPPLRVEPFKRNGFTVVEWGGVIE